MTFCHSFIRFCFPKILILNISIHITSSASLSSAYQLELSRILYTTEFTERSDVHLHSTSELSLRKVQQYTQHQWSSWNKNTQERRRKKGGGEECLTPLFLKQAESLGMKHFRVCFVVALAPELWKQSSFNVHTYLLQPQGSHITGSSTDSTQGDSTATIY